MKLYGLIGYPLSHSFSRKYFQQKFEEEKIAGCEYRNFELPSIESISTLLQEPGLEGFNITIPYKEQIIPFLDRKSQVVEKTGACNCVRIIDQQLTGFNTDVIGFEVSLRKSLQPHHRLALILGTGGASKAVAYVLERLGIGFRYVSRSHSGALYVRYQDLSDEMITNHTLIVNTTPTGMYPHTDAAPDIKYEALTARHYLYDLIYNPEKTLYLQKGEEMGAVTENGHDMLIIQAEESWKIWNSDPAAWI